MDDPTPKSEAGRQLAEAIVDTLPEPFLVLDDDLRVVLASRSFYAVFQVTAAQTQGSRLYALGNGQWNIPALRTLLDTIIPRQTAMENFEVQHDFPGVGPRIMLLNARKVIDESGRDGTILLSFRDITAARGTEREKQVLLEQTRALLHQKQVLIQEMEHRVANSLQIIASILLMKARSVKSVETRHHLQDAHQRVMSIAAIQQHLHAAEGIDEIDVSSYLTTLCGSIAASMTDDYQPMTVKVMSQPGKLASASAVSLGLIVTELVINCIKYAFPEPKSDAIVLITFEMDGTDWKLVVSDNGVGKVANPPDAGKVKGAGGLGTVIVQALVQQLGAQIETVTNTAGTRVSITRATFESRMPLAG